MMTMLGEMAALAAFGAILVGVAVKEAETQGARARAAAKTNKRR